MRCYRFACFRIASDADNASFQLANVRRPAAALMKDIQARVATAARSRRTLQRPVANSLAPSNIPSRNIGTSMSGAD